MANGYKQALARFEEAVRRQNMSTIPENCREGIQEEYDEAKRILVGKLSYRQLAAEERIRQEKRCPACFTPYKEKP